MRWRDWLRRCCSHCLCWPRTEALEQPWRDPSPHQIRWVTADTSVCLEVLDWGGSGPPLVLLGCYSSAHASDDFAPKLTSQFHVYGLTRRGIGASDKPARLQRAAVAGRPARRARRPRHPQGRATRHLVRRPGADAVRVAAPRSVSGLVYLDGASDPTTTATEHEPAMPDLETLAECLYVDHWHITTDSSVSIRSPNVAASSAAAT